MTHQKDIDMPSALASNCGSLSSSGEPSRYTGSSNTDQYFRPPKASSTSHLPVKNPRLMFPAASHCARSTSGSRWDERLPPGSIAGGDGSGGKVGSSAARRGSSDCNGSPRTAPTTALSSFTSKVSVSAMPCFSSFTPNCISASCLMLAKPAPTKVPSYALASSSQVSPSFRCALCYIIDHWQKGRSERQRSCARTQQRRPLSA